MQRDNKKFARKLDKSLAKLAKEKNKTVSNDKGDLENFINGSVWVYIAVWPLSIGVFPHGCKPWHSSHNEHE